jgi:tetratricopeptide (TPR) repeat protein
LRRAENDFTAVSLRSASRPALAASLQNRHLVGPASTLPSSICDRIAMTARRLLTSLLAAASLAALATAAEADTEAKGLALLDVPYSASLAGSYLAGRSADVARDLGAANTYFSAALGRDPDNPILLERVIVLRMANGEVDSAVELADRLVRIDSLNPLARLLRSVVAVREGKFDKAREEIEQTAPAPLAILTGGLLTGWSQQASGDLDGALATIQKLTGRAGIRSSRTTTRP